MNGTTTYLCLQLGIAASLLGFASAAQSDEASCGIVHKQTRDPLDDMSTVARQIADCGGR